MSSTKAPWHHWPVAVIALVFYALVAVDYTLSTLGVAAYLSLGPDGAAVMFSTLAPWLTGIWAVGVWGGLAGAWLLWKRNRWSVLLLMAAALALIFMTIWLSLFARPTVFGAIGFLGFYVLLGSSAIALLIYMYARRERSARMLI